MTRIVPGKTNLKLPVVLKFNIIDLIYIVIGVALTISTAIIMMVLNIKPFWIILIPVFSLLIIFAILLTPINEKRIYNYVGYMFKYLFSKKKILSSSLESQLGITFNEDYIKSNKGYCKIIRIKGCNFELIPEEVQDQKINTLANLFSILSKGKIIKLDTPINFISNIEEANKYIDILEKEYSSTLDKTSFKAQQLEKRIEFLKNDKLIYEQLDKNSIMFTDDYFLILYSDSKDNLDMEVESAINSLNRIGCPSYYLNEKENKEFYMNFFDLQNQKDDIDNLKLNNITEKGSYLLINNKKYCVSTLIEYPFTLSNAWLSSISSLSGVKLIINFSKNIDTSKTIKRINKKIVSLSGLLMNKQTESDKLEIQSQIDSYQTLLEELNFSKETLHIAEIMILTEYDKQTLKNLNDTAKTIIKCKIDPLTFRQFEAYTNCFPNIPSKEFKDLQRDFQASTLASSFPFISDLFIDKKGIYLGGNSNPVFFDMFYNLHNLGSQTTRSNANIMILGASGKGKSYFMKILIMNSLAYNSKIFILDPENEYSYIANNFKGDVIDVSGGDIKINPFEIFPELNEEGSITKDASILNKHFSFLSDFFKVVLPDLTPYTRQTLNNLMGELYASKGIYNFGIEKEVDGKKVYDSISNIKSSEFPTFDDLINLLESKDYSRLIQQDIQAFIELKAYLKDFSSNGKFSLWNGKTTLNLKNDFIVFNFRGLETGSQEIRNGQMLLITKFLMKEVINNSIANKNVRKEDVKKVILAVDEAHVFIDPKFPVALDTMKDLAKRIRKYSGSLWVTTQNIADFIGGEPETIKKATAVMNNCQYSFIFGLKSNDLKQVKEMYSGNGISALTEEEVSFISSANQGDVLLLVDESTRIPFHVALKDPEFEEGLIRPIVKQDEIKSEGNIQA